MKNSEITIRNIRIEDFQAITELSIQLGYKSTKSEISNRITTIMKQDNHCVLVASIEDEIIGWIHGFHALRVESDPFVEIGGLVVHENYRSRGIGRMLIEILSEWAGYVDCNKLRARCNTIRKESHHFYNKIGFVENKEQKVFDKIIG